MKLLTTLIVLSLLPFGVAWAAPADDAFAQLKTLQGNWKVKDDGSTVVYSVESNGTALLEKFEGMVSVYHLDGDSVLMTHYCSMGNQPRLRATAFANSLKEISFSFVDISNYKPGQGHINGVTIEFLSPDHIRETWTAAGKGEDPTIVELDRIK